MGWDGYGYGDGLRMGNIVRAHLAYNRRMNGNSARRNQQNASHPSSKYIFHSPVLFTYYPPSNLPSCTPQIGRIFVSLPPFPFFWLFATHFFTTMGF
jgi:hypothetical protein